MTDNFNHVTCPKCGYEENSISAQKCEICGQALKKSNSLAPIIAGVGAVAMLGGLGYFGYNMFATMKGGNAPADQTAAAPAPATTDSQPTAQPVAATPNDTLPSSSSADVSTALSWGERVLFTDAPNADMQTGATAFASGDYATATAKFEAARWVVRNDPEALIYLNNARVGTSPALGIAAVVPIGDTPNTARELLRGVAQAQAEAIDSGVPVKVLIADDGNDADKAAAIATALVKDPAIVGVIGHGTSTTTLAAAPIYQQGQLPMIAPTSTSTELATLPREGSNFIFRVIPSDQFAGTSLVRNLLAAGKTKPIVFYNSQSSYSKSLQEALSTTLGLEGGQVAKLVDLSQGNPPAELAGSEADAVVLLPDSSTFDQAIAVAQANQGQLPIWAGDAFYRIEALQKGGASLTNATVVVPWHPQKADTKFTQASASLWGGDINWRTALSYDAFQALRSARTTGNVTPDMGTQGRVPLGQALAGQGFTATGTTGPISFLPSGDRNSNVLLVKVQPGSRSGTGFDFVPF
jgi:branched-chain amino acid transport system substrate-binding protein